MSKTDTFVRWFSHHYLIITFLKLYLYQKNKIILLRRLLQKKYCKNLIWESQSPIFWLSWSHQIPNNNLNCDAKTVHICQFLDLLANQRRFPISIIDPVPTSDWRKSGLNNISNKLGCLAILNSIEVKSPCVAKYT